MAAIVADHAGADANVHRGSRLIPGDLHQSGFPCAVPMLALLPAQLLPAAQRVDERVDALHSFLPHGTEDLSLQVNSMAMLHFPQKI